MSNFGNTFVPSGGGSTSNSASADGWILCTGTWIYSSADSPIFVISVNNDQTKNIGVGTKIKYTQTTVKYGIVVSVGVYSGGVTLIAIYGGTDYTLLNAAIVEPYYSREKAPFGFPLSPAKWTVTYSNNLDYFQSSPTANNWYNIGGMNTQIPIGAWITKYRVAVNYKGNLNNITIFVSLSTASNSESDVQFTDYQEFNATKYNNNLEVNNIVFTEKLLVLSAKTTYYIIAKTSRTGMTQIGILGAAVSVTNITCTCAYL